MELTGVDCSDGNLNDHDGQWIESGQGAQNLLEGRQLCDHIEEHRGKTFEMSLYFSSGY